MKKHYIFITLLVLLLICRGILAKAQKIKVYFNSPVNTSVSTGSNAVYLNNAIDDTLIEYINRANSTIDVAVYNFVQSGNMSNVATAINNAFTRGVKIRWIYNTSSSNSGLNQLNNGIHTLESPSSSSYNIMHNKFMVVDRDNPNDAIVWTGSCNWNDNQFNDDVNNVIIFQDSALAHAYTVEFNEMWGDTGLTPNLTLSRFGPFKTDNTQHLFNIGGTMVECYFSPSDNTNSHIVDAINSADDDIYFGVYTFTETQDANAIADRIQNANVYSAGIIDQFSQSYSPYSILHPVMSNMLKIYNQSGTIYHNKMVIIDPCSPSSDPIVETGSHNWSQTANSTNDENTIIIHNDTIANMYYQSFFQNFLDLGGTITPCIFSGVDEKTNNSSINIFPNPVDDYLTVQQEMNQSELTIFNSYGKIIYKKKLNDFETRIPVSDYQSGIYFLRIYCDGESYTWKAAVAH